MKTMSRWAGFRLLAHAAFVALAVASGCVNDASRKTPGAAIGTGAREALRTSLASPHGHIRGMAIEAYMEQPGEVPQAEILKLMDDTDPRVQMLAIAALGKTQNQALIPRVREKLRDANANVRLAAAYTLAKVGDTEHVVRLRDGLMHPDPAVRRNAAYFLGLMGEASAAGMLKVSLKDPDALVVLRVAEAMHKLGDDSGLPTIRTLMDHGHHRIQYEAIRVLSEMGTSFDLPRLRRLAQSRFLDVKFAAVGALAKLGDFARIDILIEVLNLDKVDNRTRDRLAKKLGVAVNTLKQAESETRAMAALMLGDAGYSPALPSLERLLRSRDPLARVAGATAILQIQASPVPWRRRAHEAKPKKEKRADTKLEKALGIKKHKRPLPTLRTVP
ncbi:MAG: HEAT repeat domain-containing protein [Planctomycetia bacterium]|nr:HEAT repeat domain-containing protein [Planctomycetia bacterium]